MKKVKNILLISHIKVQNANALSSPFTIGFPAMTAWLGATHALQRKLNVDGFEELIFNAVAVVSHHADLQTHKGIGDFVHSIIGSSNPLDKDGKRPAFIEEARVHLDVSLVIEYDGLDRDDKERFETRVAHHLKSRMKIAGGDILHYKNIETLKVKSNDDEQLARVRRKLMPGYALIERRDLMCEAMEQGLDGVDALLDYLVIHNSCEKKNEKVIWTKKRKTTGWILPIAIGFQGVSDLGKAKNQRDSNTPHRFAEAVVTFGEFKIPYKIDSLDEILWRYSVDSDKDLYLCEQIINNDKN
ncbi:MAG: type I-F CRISPR-associated protein Csy2 [Sulfurovum sp.]